MVEQTHNRLLEEVVECPLSETIQNLTVQGPEQHVLVDPDLSRGVGVDHLHRSLPTPVILSEFGLGSATFTLY